MKTKLISLIANVSLIAQYGKIQRAGLDNSHAYPGYGTPVAIDTSFVVKISNSQLLVNLLSMQNRLKEIIGDHHAFNQIPETMHLTLLNHLFNADASIVYDLQSEVKNADSIFRGVKLSPWSIHFKGLLVTPNSIIVKGYDNGVANGYRHQLVASGIDQNIYDNDKINNVYPNIVHIKLINFKTPLDKSIIQTINNKFGNTFFGSETVENVHLRNFDLNAMYSPGTTYHLYHL